MPFYGQGCNAAFEDCVLLDELWKEHDGSTDAIFRAFSAQRKPHVDAIGELAVEHYHVSCNPITAVFLAVQKRRVAQGVPLPQELANKVTPSWTTRAWRAFSGVVEESTIFRKAIAPGYTSLYHAVSFGRELGYADARKLGLASEEHLDRASMVLAGGLGLALAGALAFKARGTVGAG